MRKLKLVYWKGVFQLTKKFNKGSRNQNSPQAGLQETEFANEVVSGDNSKGNKRNNKAQKSKTNPQ
jgi:hypothetical protein